MSGDTPTRYGGMKLHNLECPDCSSDVFARETAHWTPDLTEHCAGCGSDLRVALDEDPEDPDVLTPRVFVYEHGGEVVARLLADIEQLKYEQDYTPPTGAVSEGLRACVKAAGQACLDGEADCPKAGCVVGHRAGEILDAYDDAAAEVERLADQLTQDANDRKECEAGAIERDRMRKEFAATIERLTEERDAIWAERVEEGKVAARAGREAAELRTRAEQAEAAHSASAEALLVAVSWLLDMGADSTTGNAACIELLAAHRVAEYAIKRAGVVGAYTVVDEAADLRVQLGVVQREVCERRSRDHGPRYGDDARFATKARSIAAALGWDCYDSPGGATPSEPGNTEYIAWSDGGMVGPAPGHGEPAYTCSGCGKPAQPKHPRDMDSACCDLPIERHGEPGGEQ